MIRRSRRAQAARLLAVALLATAAPASAQTEADKTQARELAEKGFAAEDRGDHALAEELLRKADDLYHAATLTVGLARAQAAQGKYVAAWENYHRVVFEGVPPRASPAIVKAVEAARAEIDAVAQKRAAITLTVTGSSQATVTLDGAPLPAAALGNERPVDPGAHAAHAEAPGCKTVDRSFTLRSGESEAVPLVLECEARAASTVPGPQGSAVPAPPPPAPSEQPSGAQEHRGAVRAAGFAVGAAGIGGLIAGSVTGGLAIQKHSDLQKQGCGSSPCSTQEGTAYNSGLATYRALGTASTVAFAAGGALTAAGIVLVLVSGHDKSQTLEARPVVGLGFLGVGGSFR